MFARPATCFQTPPSTVLNRYGGGGVRDLFQPATTAIAVTAGIRCQVEQHQDIEGGTDHGVTCLLQNPLQIQGGAEREKSVGKI